MQLNTLGVLELSGDNYRSEKPLLLLVYLAHREGTWLRNEAITEVIWPGAADPAHSLNVAVSSLRAQTSLDEHIERNRGTIRVQGVTTDAQSLLIACEQKELERIDELYRKGQFLQAVDPDQYPELFEDWIKPEQAKIRGAVWQAFLDEVETRRSDKDRWLSRAYELTQELPPLESRQFTKLFALLSALEQTNSALGRRVITEAKDFDVPDLPATIEEARDLLGWNASKEEELPQPPQVETVSIKLLTLGKLSLENSEFRQQKPLLLLAYLASEGKQTRKRVAELFWPTGKDPLNNLSRLLKDLRKAEPDSFWSDNDFVEARVQADTTEFQAAVRSKNYQKAADLYQGAFLETVHPSENIELEEWLYRTREVLARQAQEALLNVAEAEAQKGAFFVAARQAEKAFGLLSDSEPETLRRIYTFLVAGESALTSRVQQEAAEYGVKLNLLKEEARLGFQRTFVGRKAELERLETLGPGSFAWLQGATGMGKTALLESLPGTYLPARDGLPYATLETLLETSVGDNEEFMLRKLMRIQDTWLIDDWEQMDKESQRLLERLHPLRPAARVIIASRRSPVFQVDVQLELHPLTARELDAYPGIWEATEGLPALVGAYLRDEPLVTALKGQLEALPEQAKQVYVALNMLEEPDLILVRNALEFSAADMAEVLARLQAMGLVTTTGKLRVNQVAKSLVEDQVTTETQLALKLARQLKGVEAFPFYSRAKLFWEEEDFLAVQKAYIAWADELLRRGAPQRASEVLEEAPSSEEVMFLRAKALEAAGRYKEALELAENLRETPNVMALRGALYWRLGEQEKAKVASEQGFKGDMEARAKTFNTLGNLKRSEGEHDASAEFTRRAAALWQMLGKKNDWATSLNNLAVSITLAGGDSEDAFEEALEAAGENPRLRARVLSNYGWKYERDGDYTNAADKYLEGAKLAKEAKALDTAAKIFNNLGVIYHKQEKISEAKDAYRNSLNLAQQVGEHYILGMAMANLSELDENFSAWQEALYILEQSGHGEVAQEYRNEIPPNHPFSHHLNEGA